MTAETITNLLDRNQRHTDSLSLDYFDEVLDTQKPPLVSLCCSDSRVPQALMWDAEEAGVVFTPSNIGNVAWDVRDGERVVDGNVLYPVAHTETETVAVVGHTGCGAVTAAYRYVVEGVEVEPERVRERIESLFPVVENALGSGVADGAEDESEAVNRLVEYNVREQVDFLLENDSVPDEVSVHGFVYDLHGVYGDLRGRTYLVSYEGETGVDEIRAHLPDGYEKFVRSLLDG
ncbi:MAG: carbonic anhydrase [Halobacteriales archaeon]|nr:carbonic anhydrase [Halobacteriales archaeon]